MTYSDAEVSAAVAAVDKHRGGDAGEVGAALAVVGLSAERATKEAQIRDDMIRVAHRAGELGHTRAHRAVWARDPVSHALTMPTTKKPWPQHRCDQGSSGGRDRRRSGDLALFRRALCRLSYPAENGGSWFRRTPTERSRRDLNPRPPP